MRHRRSGSRRESRRSGMSRRYRSPETLVQLASDALASGHLHANVDDIVKVIAKGLTNIDQAVTAYVQGLTGQVDDPFLPLQRALYPHFRSLVAIEDEERSRELNILNAGYRIVRGDEEVGPMLWNVMEIHPGPIGIYRLGVESVWRPYIVVRRRLRDPIQGVQTLRIKQRDLDRLLGNGVSADDKTDDEIEFLIVRQAPPEPIKNG